MNQSIVWAACATCWVADIDPGAGVKSPSSAVRSLVLRSKNSYALFNWASKTFFMMDRLSVRGGVAARSGEHNTNIYHLSIPAAVAGTGPPPPREASRLVRIMGGVSDVR